MGFQSAGTASEYFAVEATKVTLLPDDMSYEEGDMEMTFIKMDCGVPAFIDTLLPLDISKCKKIIFNIAYEQAHDVWKELSDMEKIP